MLVGLQHLGNEPLDLSDFNFHLLVVVDLHEDDFELVVDEFGEPLGRPIVHVERSWGGGRRGNGFLFVQRPEVLLQEDEVVFVGDEAIAVEVHLAEQLRVDLLRTLYANRVQRILHSLYELRQIHYPLAAVGVDLLAVQPLDSHLPEVLFNAEVNLHRMTCTNSLKLTRWSLSLS